MAKMIQVRNVPDRLYRELKRRAKQRRQTLTDYVEQILENEMSRLPREEVFARIAARKPIDLGRPAADLIREGRRGR